MKKIIVTGATGGIGQAIAQYLGDKNYDLILTSRRKERLQTLRSTLKNLDPGKIQHRHVDFNDLHTVREYQSWLVTGEQKIDGIVLITPRPGLKNSLFQERNEWLDLFQSSFIGPLEFIKLLIPNFNPIGKIVILSGITSAQVMEGHSMFAVLRTMWLSQAKSLSYELGPKGIYVNTVSLGGVLTESGISRMQKKAKENNRSFDAQYANSTDNVPLRKYATPKEVASVVEFFLSGQSDHVTGVNLACDGGFTRSY